jgi:hypothetical protein
MRSPLLRFRSAPLSRVAIPRRLRLSRQAAGTGAGPGYSATLRFPAGCYSSACLCACHLLNAVQSPDRN